MKIRNGFVSNSSSSSFICNICGREEIGRDVSISDCDMSECENGHIFCNNAMIGDIDNLLNLFPDAGEVPSFEDVMLIVKDEKMANILIENFKNYETIEDQKYGYELPAVFCPMCQMHEIDKGDLVLYALKKLDTSYEELSKEIKGKFKSYDELIEYFKSDKTKTK